MASDRDVMGQADALLKRHAPDPALELTDIPILTDLVENVSAPAADVASPELAQEIFRRVLGEVEGRFAADLERRLLEHLEPQLHAAVASALGDLRQDLANAIGDAVAEALKRRPVK